MKTEIEMKSFFATFLLSAGFCFATLPGGAAEEARLVDEPYGVCCHVTRGEKWDAPKLYPLMQEAGVAAEEGENCLTVSCESAERARAFRRTYSESRFCRSGAYPPRRLVGLAAARIEGKL